MAQQAWNTSTHWNQATTQQMLGSKPQMLYSTTGSTFEIGRTLGDGGMGSVYLAFQQTSHARRHERRLVAIKLLRPDAPNQARRLFYHEGVLLPRLRHHNIVRYVEHGRGAIPGVGTLDYLAISYIAGKTIEDLLRSRCGPLPLATVVGIIAQLTSALEYLHQRGIVHCDLKPSNIMLEQGAPHAILIDFGIARAPDFVGQPIAVGTPQYMAPEQTDALNECDGRADIYALGILIYELLTGRRLFVNRTTTDLRQGRMLMPDVNDLTAALHTRLVHVVTCCLQPNPEARYPTATDLFDDLLSAAQHIFEEPPVLASATRVA